MAKNLILLILGGFAIYGAIMIDLNVIRESQRSAILSNVNKDIFPHHIIPQHKTQNHKTRASVVQKRHIINNRDAKAISQIVVKKDAYYN